MPEAMSTTEPDARTPRTPDRTWPRMTTYLLLAVGAVLSLVTAAAVLLMPDLPWHGARELELVETYDAYQETGVLLVKETGTGSWYTQAPGAGAWSPAAWDDDPGVYLLASVLSHVTGSESPHPGLKLATAAICALPMLVLPLAVARLFRRARAGYALLALPAVMWLTNEGTVLVGTELGLSDAASPTRVYALYGIAAALVFASLTALLLLSTIRLRTSVLVAVSLALAVLSGFGNLARSLSGMGTAAAVGVLWWLHSTGRMRWVSAAVAAAVAVTIAAAVPLGVMRLVDERRAEITQIAPDELPTAHAVWHSVYLGLAYPEPFTGQPSRFGVPWSDEFGWAKAREVDPDVLIASNEFDAIMKDVYRDAVSADPGGAVRLYVEKFLFTLKHFGGMLAVAAIGIGLALRRHGAHRRRLGATLAIATPTLLVGLAPPVLVMPLLYYFSELSAALGLLVAVGTGAFAWVVTSLPSSVRAVERRRVASRLQQLTPPSRAGRLSVVVPTRNGEGVIAGTLERLAEAVGADDEIVVVENGSTDATSRVLDDLAATWSHPCRLVVEHSAPGLGAALRAGVLASDGDRLLLTADDLPFGTTDLEQFRTLPASTVVAIGSKAHPDSDVHRSRRRTNQSRIFRLLRQSLLHSQVGDSQGTLWVDARWCRMFAAFSRETGLMWTTELVMAAEIQGIPVVEVPVTLREGHDAVTSRFSFGDALRGVRGIARLALQKDDYLQDDWLPGGPADADELPAGVPAGASSATADRSAVPTSL